MKRDVAHRVAFLGVVSALIFVMLTLETYIFIGILGINPAFLSLPMAIALSLYGDWKDEFYGGTIFGVCAFIISFMVGYVPMYNPLISILPRLLMGVGAYWMYHLLSYIIHKIIRGAEKKGKLYSKKKNIFYRETLPAAVAGAIGALINTVLVLTMMSFFGGDAFATAFKVAISFNSPIEMACCFVLVPIYVRVMKIALKSQNKLLFVSSTENNS